MKATSYEPRARTKKKMKDFKKLKVWQQGMEIAKITYDISRELPTQEKFGLVSQITRSATCIPANIAEGHGRGTDKERARFMEIALGSSYELETHIILIGELGFISNDKIDVVLKLIDDEQRMLGSLIKLMRQE